MKKRAPTCSAGARGTFRNVKELGVPDSSVIPLSPRYSFAGYRLLLFPDAEQG